MRAFGFWLTCMALTSLLACGKDSEKPKLLPEPTPLTVEEWKPLPFFEKFDGATLERLRMHDEKLRKSERAWSKFMREVVIPERQKGADVSTS